MQFSRPASTTRATSPEVDAPTRERVVRTILEKGPSTAADLAQALDLTAAAVRRHLDQLVEAGVLEPVDQRLSGARGRGRPAKAFALTQAGRDGIDNTYDDLAAQALRFIAESAGPDAVAAFARSRVEFIERDYETVRAADPDLSPAQVLAKVFTTAGYAATTKELPIVGEQLCQQHCPVSHVAHEFPQLCEAETEAISRVLGTHVQRLATIAHGDGVCTTCIPQLPHHKNAIKEKA